MNIEPRARIRCPRCQEVFVDTDMREWMDSGRSPDEFTDAMMRLVNAHADTCRPRPPAYTKKMRHGRMLWRLGVWFPATWFTLVAAAQITGLLDDTYAGWHLLIAGICMFLAGRREQQTYHNGYVRGYFAGEHHQPYLIARWLHPGDTINDPADPPTHGQEQS